jgi:hypothetical protein
VDPAQTAESRWVNDRFPEIGTYRRLDDQLLARLLDWASPTGATVVFDRSCRPARLTRRGGMLRGFVHQQFDFDAEAPDAMTESFSELEIGFRFYEYASNWTSYRRGRSGSWVVDSEGGYGDVRQVEHLLSAVTESAAWFNDGAVGLKITCTRVVTTAGRCKDGNRRTCDSCESWGPTPTTREADFGIGRTLARHKKVATGPMDCSNPCPAIEEPPDATRANRALENEGFVVSIDPAPKPLLFKTAAACRDYTKKHPFTSDERDVWHGDTAE